MKDREVQDAVAHGARSIEDLQERCNAGSDCGGCHPALAELLGCEAHRLVSATPAA